MKDYKIAVYTICKNEESNVDAWIKSMSEADYICVLDTGSTDKTYEKLLEWQKSMPSKIILNQAIIIPWRFDIARNESMKLIPKDADFCICTDLDERLTKGWGNAFRLAWDNSSKHRLFYKYAWSHNEDGTPARVFWYDKCHDNSGDWSWKFPVHETLYHCNDIDGSKSEGYPVNDQIWLHHYPAHKDERSNYLPLLEKRAQEDPEDYYGLVYLAHEYFYQGHYQKCIDFIDKQVLPKIAITDIYDCCTDLYMFKGKSYEALENNEEAIKCYKYGIVSKPEFRDNYLCLAQVYLKLERYQDAIDIVNEALLKTRRLYSWLEWDKSWTSLPSDILALAYFHLGAIDTSLMYAKMALNEDKGDERLQHNVEFISNYKH